MHFAEIFGSRSKEQNNYNFNEIGLIFRLAFLSANRFDTNQNINAISLKFLLFCGFDFDPKISTKSIYSVYYFFQILNLRVEEPLLLYQLNNMLKSL